MGGVLCWSVAIVALIVAAAAFYHLSRIGAAIALQRDRQQHLAIVNAARRRAGKPPLTEADLPPEPDPEPDPLLEKLLGLGKRPGRGFAVQTPDPAAPPVAAPPSHAAARAALPVEAAALPVEVAAPPAGPTPVVVLLEGKPRDLDAARLRAAAERAWHVEFPDDPNATDWVLMTHPGTALISCGGFQFIVENHDTSYFHDPRSLADSLREFRTQQAVRDCRAWRSVAVARPDPALDDDTAYALLAKLAVELAGNSTLGVYLPRLQRLFPYDDTTVKALLSDDPLASLRQAPIPWVPLMASDDLELDRAMREARRRLGEFKEAFASRSITGGGKHSPFLVKARFPAGDEAEHMWVEVTSIHGQRFTGILRSSPVLTPGLVEGEEVTVLADDISDWIATLNGQTIGDFTGPIIRRRHGGKPT